METSTIIILIICVICICLCSGSSFLAKDLIPNPFGFLTNPIGSVTSAIGNTFSSKTASFCCDLFTKEQLKKMSKCSNFKCNPDCNRRSPGCIYCSNVLKINDLGECSRKIDELSKQNNCTGPEQNISNVKTCD
jgi:hypothetical protein